MTAYVLFFNTLEYMAKVCDNGRHLDNQGPVQDKKHQPSLRYNPLALPRQHHQHHHQTNKQILAAEEVSVTSYLTVETSAAAAAASSAFAA